MYKLYKNPLNAGFYGGIMSLGKLNINLSLETAEFQQGLDKSSHQARKFIKSFETDLDRAKNSAKQFSERTAKYLNNIERAAISINKTTSRHFLASIGSFAASHLSSAASKTLQYADSYTELQNRMRLVTESTVQMVAATECFRYCPKN